MSNIVMPLACTSGQWLSHYARSGQRAPWGKLDLRKNATRPQLTPIATKDRSPTLRLLPTSRATACWRFPRLVCSDCSRAFELLQRNHTAHSLPAAWQSTSIASARLFSVAETLSLGLIAQVFVIVCSPVAQPAAARRWCRIARRGRPASAFQRRCERVPLGA
jgi:hypothetical protein